MPLIEWPRLAAEQAAVPEKIESSLSFRHEHTRQHAIEAGAEIVGGSLDGLMESVDTVSCHCGIVRGGGGHSEQESVETAAAGVDARFAHPGPQSGGVERARCSTHRRKWCQAKLRERVGGDRGIGVFQPGSEPPQPLARWQIAGWRRRHVAQQRLVGRDCRPGETDARGLRSSRPDRAKEHRRSGDLTGHASRHGRADGSRGARVAEHLVDAKSLR